MYSLLHIYPSRRQGAPQGKENHIMHACVIYKPMSMSAHVSVTDACATGDAMCSWYTCSQEWVGFTSYI